ncbi:60Kd inner membrane protein domain-containing protein [Ditylenchus destructor]|uniref:60Kd inner membrane protein domain-containing protein n=1 Tax=Ditylenchus destructor TaxID=166010 RepID=A0AAD4N8E0_9BILA|nr:60Kd inner membrane protein domain-containing protein [Ditylenchus destructor]
MLSHIRANSSRCLLTIKTLNKSSSRLVLPQTCHNGPHAILAISSVRFLSTKDLLSADSEKFNVADIPELIPPVPKPTIEDMLASGQSILKELEIWSWWKPSSYFRWMFEAAYINFDLPWWGTICAGTFVLRLLMIFVPVMAQKSAALNSRYRKEIAEFRDRIQDAKAEGNNLLVQQIFLEQMDFMKRKGIKMGRQMLILCINGGVFMSNFFALKKMINANYPGFADGGALWFTDLTTADPYWLLPIISAITIHLVIRSGVDSGSMPQDMPSTMRLAMLYGMPAIIFFAGSQMPAGILVYWCTSNCISLSYAILFRMQAVRNILNLPPIEKSTVSFMDAINELKSKNKSKKSKPPPSILDLKKKDLENFRKAGRGKPIIDVKNK